MNDEHIEPDVRALYRECGGSESCGPDEAVLLEMIRKIVRKRHKTVIALSGKPMPRGMTIGAQDEETARSYQKIDREFFEALRRTKTAYALRKANTV